eukprot:7380469-Prymnesium_polylepis.1
MRVVSLSPSSGPAEGQTSVRVTGSGFRNSTLLRCKFGAVNVESLLLNSTLLECVSPRSANAATEQARLLTFDDYSSYSDVGHLHLGGAARVEDGAVQLTAEGAGVSDGFVIIEPSLVLPPTHATHLLSSFVMQCDLFLGSHSRQRFSSTGGTGVSFHFGALRSGAGPQELARTGLTVRLLTRGPTERVSPHVSVLLHGREVLHVATPRLTTNAAAPFYVRLEKMGLRVEFNSAVLVEELKIDALRPAETWAFGFSAFTTAYAHDLHSVDNVRIAGLGDNRAGRTPRSNSVDMPI